MVEERRISGIICEFNPLHNGHKYLLNSVKEKTDGYIVCVMSGNFVQRGECAIIDKQTRTELALKNGADLVLELPLPFAVAGAEKFASGGIHALESLGCVDNLFFGSESDNCEELCTIAEFLLSGRYALMLKKEISSGNSFAICRERIVSNVLGDKLSAHLKNSNDILGIEYIKAILKFESSIVPRTVHRIGSSHDSLTNVTDSITSAMNIRRMLNSGADFSYYVPRNTQNAINELSRLGECPADIANCARAIIAFLRSVDSTHLKNISDVSEGIENKVVSAARNSGSLDGLYSAVKSKRYSHARIRRIILSAFLGISKDFNYYPEYIRVLGMNENGEKIIKSKMNKLPFVSSLGDVKKLSGKNMRLFELEAHADDIYSVMTPQITRAGNYYTNKIIKI